MALLTPLFIGVNIFSILLAIIIIFVNAVAIFLIFRKERDWENTCYFIANLAVSDGLTGALIVANVIFNLIQHQIFYECIFRLSAVNSAIFASVFILLGVTCDRYVKIVCPLRYTTFMNELHVKIYLCIIWTISCILIVTPFLLWIHDVIIMDMCSYFVILKEQYLIGYCLTIFFAMLIQLFMYIHIFVIAVSQGWRSEVMTHGQTRVQVPQRAIINHIVKPSRAIFTMVGINVLTSIPVGIYVYLATTHHFHNLSYNKQGEYLMYVATPLYLNSLINPFLYAYKIPDIRRTLSRFIPWLGSSNRVEAPTTSYSLNRLGISNKPTINDLAPANTSKGLESHKSSNGTKPSTPIHTTESHTTSSDLLTTSSNTVSSPVINFVEQPENRSKIESRKSNTPKNRTTSKCVEFAKASKDTRSLRASKSLDQALGTSYSTESSLPNSYVEPSCTN